MDWITVTRLDRVLVALAVLLIFGPTIALLDGWQPWRHAEAQQYGSSIGAGTGSCTNQFVRSNNVGSAPTCATVAAADLATGAVTGAKIRMGGDVQGDVLYFNGTDYARLGVGTSGQFLTANGAGTNPTWTTAGGGAGGFVGTQTFTTGTTYTPSTGVKQIFIRMVGGGGGGGGAATCTAAGSVGGGGGGGGYAERYFAGIDGAASYTIAIGSGGAGGAAGNNAGAAGGNTTFACPASCTGGAVTVTAGGGAGGAGSATNSTCQFGGGAAGGTSTNGNVNIPGGDALFGTSCVSNTVWHILSSGGGSSAFSSGSPTVISNASTANSGVTGNVYGGGGEGGYCADGAVNVAGGAGAAGLIVVMEYK